MDLDLNRLRVFYEVAKAQSFSHTSLNLSISSISRHVSYLENRLKKKLFHRYPKKIVLTEEGRILFETAQKIFKELEGLKETFNHDPNQEKNITLYGPSDWLNNYLIEYLVRLSEAFPHINLKTVNVKIQDEIDFNYDGIECAILPYQPFDLKKHYVKIGLYTYRLFASESYVEKYGKPNQLSDLKNHKLVSSPHFEKVYYHTFREFFRYVKEGEKAPLDKKKLNIAVENVVYAIHRGAGIGALPYPAFEPHMPGFVSVLPDYESSPVPIYFIYPYYLKNNPTLVSILHFFKEQFKNIGMKV
jgi:DNA-binding transcriptional LysR family regulator